MGQSHQNSADANDVGFEDVISYDNPKAGNLIMPLFNVTLDSGIVIRAVASYQSDTYEGGLAIGQHSDERVQRKLSNLEKFAQQNIPTPVLSCLPEDIGSPGRGWCLPMYTIITWFVSDTPIRDSHRCGSHLATVHFQDNCYPPFNTDNENALRSIDWQKLASDFDY